MESIIYAMSGNVFQSTYAVKKIMLCDIYSCICYSHITEENSKSNRRIVVVPTFINFFTTCALIAFKIY